MSWSRFFISLFEFGLTVLIAIAVVFVGLVVHRTRLKKKSQLAALDYWARFRGDISCLNASERREKFWF